MAHCPSCGAHRDDGDDYCPVCGETLTQVHLSEATGDPWFERIGRLLILVVLFWPAALYGVSRRGIWKNATNQWLLAGCVMMALVWAFIMY